MNRFLSYLSLRFWVVCLICLPVSFWALPKLMAWLPEIPVLAFFMGIFVLMGLGLGLLLDFFGERRIRTLIREGELWERAGIQARAEKRYIRAMGVFDSAWLSPWAAWRSGPELKGALARFYLTTESCHPGFKMAAVLNVKANPGDETLARLWLGRQTGLDRADGLTQSVLTALADAHYGHPEIARQLICVFVSLGRMDFSAKRLYRHFMDFGCGSSNEDEAIRSDIRHLMGKVTTPEPIIDDTTDISPAQTLGDQRNKTPIRPQAASPGIIRPSIEQGGRFMARELSRLLTLFKAGGRGFIFLLTWLGSLIPIIFNWVREKEKSRLYLKWGLMGGLGIWLVFFAWTTFSHMIKSTDRPGQRIEVKISKPLTIQVAAYLKQAHADRYVAVLKKKGVLAGIKKTAAGGKTWYLVRISEFMDKKSAENYGNSLKLQKIIDDFFVSNK